MIKKIKPTSGYALIEPIKLEKKTSTGIVLPDTLDSKSQKGKVIAIGKPRITDTGSKIQAEFKVGDTVVYKKWGGDEVKLDLLGKEMMFVKFEDILAIIS